MRKVSSTVLESNGSRERVVDFNDKEHSREQRIKFRDFDKAPLRRKRA